MLFINYNPKQGISINTYRQPEGYYNSDVSGLIDDMVAGKPGSCPLEGALDALQDGSIWPSDAAQSALEELHSAIIAHMRQNGQQEEADSYFS